MSKFFYARLAAVNIKKNGRIYIPYILTCIFTICMFYIMLFISLNKGLSLMQGAEAMASIMWMGTVVIGLFSVVILLYTNSFLMKRRKKELGLYNILGMGKNHIAKVMTIENLYISSGTIVSGLFFGILLSKLMLALLMKMLHFRIPFGFEVSPIALIVTVIVFAGIFFITLLTNLGRVRLSKPIELLYGGNVGEKEPKTKWLLAIIGFLALAIGYTIAMITENPIDALGLFFIAVLLVIFGTYCLFTAGSIALLKALRNNKSYYYTTKHFASVSGMLYRMKQNAVGLANICILSTMVLVMLSTTVSLYLGLDDALRTRFPREFKVLATDVSKAQRDEIDKKVNDVFKDSGVIPKNVTHYMYDVFTLQQSDSHFSFSEGLTSTDDESATVFFIPLEEYNKLQGVSESLTGKEVLVYAPNTVISDDTVSFGTLEYTIKSTIDQLNVEDSYSLRFEDKFYFIVQDEQSIKDIFSILTNGDGYWQGLSYYYGFDTASERQVQLDLARKLDSAVAHEDSNDGEGLAYVTSAEESRETFLYLHGGLLFLGIFLGTLFIMAMVIIMYYKQISEGYDDKKRFEIMQKVGLGHHEVKATIRSQILTVFFLPLLAAGIHILAAFKMITKLLFMLNLTNVQLFARCTLGTLIVFAVIYGIVYTLTARTYYKIVS